MCVYKKQKEFTAQNVYIAARSNVRCQMLDDAMLLLLLLLLSVLLLLLCFALPCFALLYFALLCCTALRWRHSLRLLGFNCRPQTKEINLCSAMPR